jgi:hypothetical protein
VTRIRHPDLAPWRDHRAEACSEAALLAGKQ